MRGFTDPQTKPIYPVLKKPEVSKDILEIDKKMRSFIDQQRNPNKIQLAPIRESLRNPDSLLYQKFPVNQDRYNKFLSKEGPIWSSQNSISIIQDKKLLDCSQSSKETLKNLEIIENLRKRPQIPQNQLKKIESNRFLQGQPDDLRANLALIEERRRSIENSAAKDLASKTKIQDSSDFQKNISKFFAVDEETEEELPSQSEFKVDIKVQRFAKTNLKSVVHDPITGNTLNYAVERNKPRSLGSKPPEVFPGKIYDSPPQVKYELPKNTKRSPKSTIFNPLTHETIRFEGTGNIFNEGKLRGNGSESGFKGFNY